MNSQKHKNSFLSVLLLAALFSSAHTHIAQAAPVTATGTNPAVCNQEVGNSTNVTAVRLAGGDCVVQFRNAGSTTWTVPAGVTSVSALVIGGGGGGGFGSLGGGGGAGEVLISGITTLSSGVVSGFSAIPVTPSALVTIVIGSGGTSGAPSGATATSANWASQSATATKGGNGGPSSFGSVTADGGGGGGGSSPNNNGQPGGSGGGSAASGSGGAVDLSGVSGWSSYKNVGETNSGGYGGGGGAGGAGGLPSSTRGGAGISVSITGTSVKYAGGGGGWGALGAENNLEDATLGGNGRLTSGNWPYAGSSNNTSPGAANTGTGGGAGAPGGSGIVIIRYSPDITAPTFTNSTTFSFAENSATSSNAATITVNESSTVSINSGSDSALFTVVVSDSVTARIRFLSSPNFESPTDVGANNGYELSIRATDTAGNVGNQSIIINVTNVNEAPTIDINSSASTHSITQAENSTSVITYTASDVDAGSSLSFSISGTDSADFAINSSSGVLTFAASPDFEAPIDSDANNTYIVTITVSDGALSDTQTLTVTITNANENSNIGAPTVSGTINKGVSTTITVTSDVAGKVRFFVGGKRISTCLARSTTGSYPNFSATCPWKPPVTGRHNITARVTPTDSSFSATTSAATSIWVVKRSNSR